MSTFKMTTENYSCAPVCSADPPIAEAVPSTTTPSQESYYNEEAEAENPSDNTIMVGCGVLGWMVGGPFIAILTALGGKYAADKSQGPIGDTSRAVGKIATAAGKKAREERIFSKVKAAISSIFRKKECPHCNNSSNNE